MIQADTIIVGQGLCGTFLSWNLLKAGQQVMVIDESIPNSATKVASGVINPVTGRRIVRTWEIERFMPFAVEAYTQLGKELGQNIISQCNILDFHATSQNKIAFTERLVKETEYLSVVEDQQWETFFNLLFGVGEIHPCWLIQLQDMLSGWRNKLSQENILIEEKFDWDDCNVNSIVQWKNIQAKQIIFCDGTGGLNNPYFKLLPYATNKGEALIVKIPELPRNNIYKQGISVVPWKEDYFWVGSTYEWAYENLAPTKTFLDKTTQQLSNWLKLPFEIVDHLASERPANVERRPFVGFHPIHSKIGVLNGMGTKGCSLAPYFAHQLTQHILNGEPIHPLANVQRFKNILSR
ncbi:NAD(P)/FAD-dependent oxidoreductase [Sediminibacterium sp.]|uniref:NAD(P)/FAD-dependent oxidoreductase n=1 Tax=Sediminibacterium sp. TaxID=1917865 RepID=UPI003F6FA761